MNKLKKTLEEVIDFLEPETKKSLDGKTYWCNADQKVKRTVELKEKVEQHLIELKSFDQVPTETTYSSSVVKTGKGLLFGIDPISNSNVQDSIKSSELEASPTSWKDFFDYCSRQSKLVEERYLTEESENKFLFRKDIQEIINRINKKDVKDVKGDD